MNVLNRSSLCKDMGLCLQDNCFWDKLTLKEYLVLYASVKKVPEDSVMQRCHKCVDNRWNRFSFFLFSSLFWSKSLISKLELDEYADQYVMNLNENIKRKPSFAIAMLADSNIILLDGTLLKNLKIEKNPNLILFKWRAHKRNGCQNETKLLVADTEK